METDPQSASIFTQLLILLVLTLINSLMHPKPERAFCIDVNLLIEEKDCEIEKNSPAEKLNDSKILSGIVALIGITYLVVKLGFLGGGFDLNTAILVFLLLGVIFYGSPIRYVNAIGKASSSCAGIILQFPFYTGIMGIMTCSSADGISLAGAISEACISIANQTTFPLLSFLSAGLVNVFVPSGGGQWAVQGPIMIPAGVELGVNPAITGMAIAWGDAWTNLIQPFWALPALAIAKLDAKDIMGYCLIDLFVVGIIVCAGFVLLML